MGHVHTGLVVKTIGSLRIQLSTEELDVCTDIFSGFTSILDLKTREPEFEVKAKAVMESESSPVSGKSCKEDELSYTPVVLEPVLASLLQVLLISVQLFL